jgi:hypothetical protein
MATVIFVSKRCAPIAAALLCLMAGRLLASATAAASPTEVRVAIGR